MNHEEPIMRIVKCMHTCDTYIHVKPTIAVPDKATAAALVNNTNKKLIFKNCAAFTNCTSKVNNTSK